MDSSGHCQNTHAHHHHHHHHVEVSPDCPFHGSLLNSSGPHHHHLELSPHCPIHSSLSQLQLITHHHSLPHCQNNQSNSSSPFLNFISPLLSAAQNPQPTVSAPSLNNFNPQVPEIIHHPHSLNEVLELEPEDEQEFEFVLTDEWKEFFAKSEAKRRLAKKDAMKKGKD